MSINYFLLQQSEFLSHYVGAFENLSLPKELFDVTLACEDETVEAHKVVISACSPFFRNVLRKTKQNHPFIYLKGVLYKDLLALMDYMYTGETKIPERDLDIFLEAAQELKINGLVEKNNKSERIDDVGDSNEDKSTVEIDNVDDTLSFMNESVEPLDISWEKVVNENVPANCEECGKVFKNEDKLAAHVKVHTKKEIKENIEIKSESIDEKEQEQTESIDEKEQEQKLRYEISKRCIKLDTEEDKKWKCAECGKLMKSKSKLGGHIEIHLEGFSHRCAHCDKSFKTRNSLQFHTSVTHKGGKLL